MLSIKRFFLVLLVLILSFSLFACEKEKGKEKINYPPLEIKIFKNIGTYKVNTSITTTFFYFHINRKEFNINEVRFYHENTLTRVVNKIYKSEYKNDLNSIYSVGYNMDRFNNYKKLTKIELYSNDDVYEVNDEFLILYSDESVRNNDDLRAAGSEISIFNGEINNYINLIPQVDDIKIKDVRIASDSLNEVYKVSNFTINGKPLDKINGTILSIEGDYNIEWDTEMHYFSYINYEIIYEVNGVEKTLVSSIVYNGTIIYSNNDQLVDSFLDKYINGDYHLILNKKVI